MTRLPSKTCVSCGRRMVWRRRWARSWDEVKYCSAACRRRGVTAVDRALEETILLLLNRLGRDATICPSEAAKVVSPHAWRELMEPARWAASRLVAAERIEILQRGTVTDASTARGPIRLRLRL